MIFENAIMERVTEEGLENTGFGNSGAPEGQGTRKNAPDEAQRSQQEQIRASLLGRILTAEARERRMEGLFLGSSSKYFNL